MARTNCNKIINVEYVKDFIGSDLKNGTGGTISINSPYSGTTALCPTYSELHNGLVVQRSSITPQKARTNKDGINIRIRKGEVYGTYQLVKQESLIKEYTRFNTFNISASTRSLPYSGGTVNLSYTNVYYTYEVAMNDIKCQLDEPEAYFATDQQDSGVTWSTNIGSISNKVLTVGANTSTSSRDIKVSGTTTFRGTSHTYTFTITQSAGTDCSKYGFMDNNWALPYRTSGTGAVATSVLSAGTLSVDSSSDWINLIQVVSADPRYAYICSISENSTGSERSGSISFKNNSGCVFTAHVTQGGEPPPGPSPGTVSVGVTIYNNMGTNVDNFAFETYKSTSSLCSKDVVGWTSGSRINLNQGTNNTTWYLPSDWFDYDICGVRFTSYYATAKANGADICDYGNFELVIEYAHDSSSGHINITLLPI